jgi:membrane-associated protease RseP (regulator of RpoE activity)
MEALGVIIFVVALLFSVMLHETGHFVTAKAFGMKATRYFVGFGPTIWSTWRGETEYGIKALPLGGFVKIIGMHSLDDVEDPADEPRAFRQQPAWQRIIVLCAGSFMHIVLAFLLFFGLALGVGIANQNTTELGTISACVYPNVTALDNGAACTAKDQTSPAKLAGLRVGDQVIAFDGKRYSSWTQLGDAIRAAPVGSAATITVRRAGQTLTLHTTLASVSGRSGAYLGIAPGVVFQTASPARAVTYAGSLFGQVVVGSIQAAAALPGAVHDLFNKTKRAATVGGQVVHRPGQRGRGHRGRGGVQSGLAVQGQLRAAADRVVEHLRRHIQHAPAAAAGRRARRHRDLGADPGRLRPAARAPGPRPGRYFQGAAGVLQHLRAGDVPRLDPGGGGHREPVENRRLIPGP